MKKHLLSILLIWLLIACSSEQATSSETTTSTTTTSTTTTSTTTTLAEINVDEYGVEILDISEEMQEQLDDLAAFVVEKVGIDFTEEPKFRFYTLGGYHDYID